MTGTRGSNVDQELRDLTLEAFQVRDAFEGLRSEEDAIVLGGDSAPYKLHSLLEMARADCILLIGKVKMAHRRIKGGLDPRHILHCGF